MLSTSNLPIRNPGSFRDPAGYVFDDGEAIWRSINADALARFQSLWGCGVVQKLVDRGLIIQAEFVSPDAEALEKLRGPRGELPVGLLRHPRVPFFSYPYEWCFSQLKDAALAHLDLQIAALELDVSLVDATPYNMQPVDGRMCHVDILSLRPYSDGEMWAGYNQFCRLFLLPLLIEAWSGVPFQPLLRGSLDGIPLGDAARLLPASKRWLTLNGILHVSLHAQQERAHARNRTREIKTPPKMPRTRYAAMLNELRNWVSGLRSSRTPSFWHDYAVANTYRDTDRRIKREFIGRFVHENQPKTIWDLGGNSGDYSVTALDAGVKHAVVLDSDLDALEIAYKTSQTTHPNLLPLVMDCSDPSPARGWNQQERAGLLERRHADAVLALALVHHLVIGRNVPLRSFVEWLMSLAPCGVVEFVPKQDPMVARMLSIREDVFVDYDEQHFIDYLTAAAEIQHTEGLTNGGRTIIAYRRRV